MNATARRTGALAACLIAGILALSWRAQTRAANSGTLNGTAANLGRPERKAANSWDPKAAAAYLDQRAGWWMEWPKAARDHETFCVSCHTALPYALSRPALRHGLAEQAPSVNERRLLDNVTKRVRLWKEVAPFYSDADRGAYKSVESRGTESVLNALILASNDAQTGRLSNDARTALDHMWAEQQTTGDKAGAWQWLRFANEPWEADDSDFYGAAVAAVAVGTAPESYRAKPEIQNNVKMLREYLNLKCAAQTNINRVALLWASAKLPGLLEPEQQRAIINEVRNKQQSDGGWSLSSLVGAWKRSDGTPQEARSDGYATGFITFVLQQAGVPREDAQLQQGLAWLAANQNKSEGFWQSYSLNKNEAHHLSPGTARFMNDAATAYAVLALTSPTAIKLKSTPSNLVCKCEQTVRSFRAIKDCRSTEVHSWVAPSPPKGAVMSSDVSIAQSPNGHLRSLGTCWIVYGVFRLILALCLFIYSATATVMFGALLSRVPNPFSLMADFHVLYIATIALSVVCGILGIIAGLALISVNPSGRLLALIAGSLSLSNIPLGTTLGIFTLVVLLPIRSAQLYSHSARAA